MTEYYDPETYPEHWNYLEPGTILDQYIIERELAHGGFSSVYLARQLADQTQVAIKEYLPRKLAHRTWNNNVIANDATSAELFKRGRALFFKEAKALVNVKHPNIVEVINFFQANSTVYMVMTYDYGISLDKFLKSHTSAINEAFLVTVFKELLLGVAAIHAQHWLHLDIKPANILIRPENSPLLLDFGAIVQFPINPEQAYARICTRGFSPIEQYNNQTGIGPWTDIYSIGATLRTCLENKVPPSAQDRLQQDPLKSAIQSYRHKYSEPLLALVDAAMQIDPADRPQSIAELQGLLNY